MTSGTLLWWYQSDCRTKPNVHMTLCPLSKNCQLENELIYISTEYTSKVGEKQFSDVWKGGKFRESKIQGNSSWLVGLPCSPQLLRSCEFTCTKCIMKLYRTVDASRVKSEIIAKWLLLLPCTVPILHGSFLIT